MIVVSRRAFLAVPALAACSRRRAGGYRGYAFIANQEGQAVAAVDLEVMAVARHIPVDGAPAQILAARTRPAVYALTPDTGAVYEIQAYRLSAARRVQAASSAVSMCLSPDERSLYVAAREPRALVSIALDSFRVEWSLPLPEEPVSFDVAGPKAAVTSGAGVWLVDLAARRVSGPLQQGDYGAVRFRLDGKMVIAANRGERTLSLFDAAGGDLVTHLPVGVQPDHLCFSQDGGQLFVTGEGMDAVSVVFPYRSEIFATVLAGRAPAAMAASASLLFVVSPGSGDVSILNLANYKVIAVVPVGADPGFVTVTPDDQYALVLNRKSGDVAVLRVASTTPNRYKWAVLTVIPVGSRPVSAAVRGV